MVFQNHVAVEFQNGMLALVLPAVQHDMYGFRTSEHGQSFHDRACHKWGLSASVMRQRLLPIFALLQLDAGASGAALPRGAWER